MPGEQSTENANVALKHVDAQVDVKRDVTREPAYGAHKLAAIADDGQCVLKGARRRWSV